MPHREERVGTMESPIKQSPIKVPTGNPIDNRTLDDHESKCQEK